MFENSGEGKRLGVLRKSSLFLVQWSSWVYLGYYGVVEEIFCWPSFFEKGWVCPWKSSSVARPRGGRCLCCCGGWRHDYWWTGVWSHYKVLFCFVHMLLDSCFCFGCKRVWFFGWLFINIGPSLFHTILPQAYLAASAGLLVVLPPLCLLHTLLCDSCCHSPSAPALVFRGDWLAAWLAPDIRWCVYSSSVALVSSPVVLTSSAEEKLLREWDFLVAVAVSAVSASCFTAVVRLKKRWGGHFVPEYCSASIMFMSLWCSKQGQFSLVLDILCNIIILMRTLFSDRTGEDRGRRGGWHGCWKSKWGEVVEGQLNTRGKSYSQTGNKWLHAGYVLLSPTKTCSFIKNEFKQFSDGRTKY